MMKWLLLALTACCVALPAVAQDAFPRVRTVTLKNGLTVLLAPDPQSTTVDVGVWYRAGTRTEGEGATGMAHLFGRLMFRGSKGHPSGEHRKLIQAEGGSLNSTVNPDYSCFYETIPPEALDLALELEADRMGSLEITPAKVETELKAVRDERRRRVEGSPLGLGLQRLYEVAFRGHPYARPVIGLDEDLARIGEKDARDYYLKRYGPSNAVLTIVGRFEVDPALALVKKRFEPVPRRASPAVAAAALPPQTAERRATRRVATAAPVVMVGWRGPADADADGAALELLARIVSGGSASRLNRALKGESKPVLFTQGNLDRRKEASLFVCMAAVKSVSDTSAEHSLIDEVERLAREPVTADELDRAKHQYESEVLFGWQTSRGRAQSIGMAQVLDGDPEEEQRRLERVRQMRADDLERAAARVFVAANRSVVWVMPSGESGSSRGAEGGVR